MDEEGWAMREVEPGKWRRVVPSPLPCEIMEIEHIRRAVAAGETLVVAGGGGIPVVRDPVEGLTGQRAVIDKDLAGALLASELSADAMLILTNVERVCLNFGRSDMQAIDRMTVPEARRWLAAGQFPPGSMGPKVQGALNFLEQSTRPDAFVVIGPLDRAIDAASGLTGTRLEKGASPR
jgi:carbamate kinase